MAGDSDEEDRSDKLYLLVVEMDAADSWFGRRDYSTLAPQRFFWAGAREPVEHPQRTTGETLLPGLKTECPVQRRRGRRLAKDAYAWGKFFWGVRFHERPATPSSMCLTSNSNSNLSHTQ